jgi:hypothetical protein
MTDARMSKGRIRRYQTRYLTKVFIFPLASNICSAADRSHANGRQLERRMRPDANASLIPASADLVALPGLSPRNSGSGTASAGVSSRKVPCRERRKHGSREGRVGMGRLEAAEGGLPSAVSVPPIRNADYCGR